MNISFKIFHESPKPTSAQKAVQKMNDANQAGFRIKSTETYLHKGSVSYCEKEIMSKNWEEFCFKTIEFAQSFGRAWTVTGDLTQELSISTNNFNSGVGVTLATIDIMKINYNQKMKLI